MRLCRKTSLWVRTGVLFWASLWMLVIPLFHVHPETDHHHGDADHAHGGTIHTVFSADLGVEYDDHHAADGVGHSTLSHEDVFIHPAHADGAAELPFIYLIDSTEQKPLKPIGSLALVGEAVEDLEPAPASFRAPHSESSPSHRFFVSDILTRAPPTPSV